MSEHDAVEVDPARLGDLASGPRLEVTTDQRGPGERPAVVGGVVGSNLARNERTAGTIVGAGAGAAAGSYIGCNQQRARAASASSGAQYRASSNLRIRSGPGTTYRQAGTLSAGKPFTAIGSQGEWVQIAGGGWVNAHYVTAN